jgi:hypothetical protein
MKKVFNIPRQAAKDFGSDDPKLPEKLVWISISEPGEQRTIISNKYLDKCANLKLSFWDLRKPIEYKGKTLNPPNRRDALRIVNFLMKHPSKSVFVNCAAGVSRSGAVAQFCEDYLGYKWPDFYKGVAIPNGELYRLMVEYYRENYLTKQ